MSYSFHQIAFIVGLCFLVSLNLGCQNGEEESREALNQSIIRAQKTYEQALCLTLSGEDASAAAKQWGVMLQRQRVKMETYDQMLAISVEVRTTLLESVKVLQGEPCIYPETTP